MGMLYHDFVAELQQLLFLFLFTIFWGFWLVYHSQKNLSVGGKMNAPDLTYGFLCAVINTSPKKEELNLVISSEFKNQLFGLDPRIMKEGCQNYLGSDPRTVHNVHGPTTRCSVKKEM